MEKENHQYKDGLNNRLSRVEDDISGLKVGQGRTNLALEGQANQLRHVSDAIDRISDKLGNKETDWKTVIAFLALVMSIGAAVLLPIKGDIQKNGRLLESTINNRWTKQDQERFEDKFDETLQREMRLLDDILQREMKLNDDAIKTKLTEIEGRIDGLPDLFETYRDKWHTKENER